MYGKLRSQVSTAFPVAELTWLGSASSYRDDAYILWVNPTAKVRSIADARKSGGEALVLAGTSEGDTSYDIPVLLRQALGLNIKLIGGYRGTLDIERTASVMSTGLL